MYKLNGQIEFNDGLILNKPNWRIDTYIDFPHGFTVPSINVRFYVDGMYDNVRTFDVDLDYSEAGTYEDTDLYNALLALPELSDSVIIE